LPLQRRKWSLSVLYFGFMFNIKNIAVDALSTRFEPDAVRCAAAGDLP
jgi:hypothetical protein